MHGFSQFLPERPQLYFYDILSPFSLEDYTRILKPVYQAIIDLDVSRAREPQDKALPDELILVKLHKLRARLGYATGSQRVESLRWLHSHRMEVAAYELAK